MTVLTMNLIFFTNNPLITTRVYEYYQKLCCTYYDYADYSSMIMLPRTVITMTVLLYLYIL